MASPKTICLLLLVVLVGLAGGLPVFGIDGAYVTLTPISGCPGTHVSLEAYFPLFDDLVSAANNGDQLPVSISSVPDRLISQLDCTIQPPNLGLEVSCTFVVSESACSGPNTVTVTLKAAVDSVSISESASASFDVPSTCGRECAVGGCVQPVNKLAMLSPWLAIIGLVGCIGTAIVVTRNRRR